MWNALQVVRCFEDDDIIHVAGKVRGCYDDSATFNGVGLQGRGGEAVGAGATEGTSLSPSLQPKHCPPRNDCGAAPMTEQRPSAGAGWGGSMGRGRRGKSGLREMPGAGQSTE